MNMHVKAGQGEIGRHQFADSALNTIFTPKALDDAKAQRKKFVQMAHVVRHCSDNFVPLEFARRCNGENQPVECLETILQGNVKGLQRLSDHMEAIRSGLPSHLAKSYDHRIESERIRLDRAREFFGKWKQHKYGIPFSLVPAQA